VYAKRTRLFLALWAVCYGVTQVCAVARAEGLTAAGLAGGAFTSAMLAGVALILIRKSRGRGLPVATAATVALAAFAWTASAGGPARADGIGDWAIGAFDIGPEFSDSSVPGTTRRDFTASDGARVSVDVRLVLVASLDVTLRSLVNEAYGVPQLDPATGRRVRVRPLDRDPPLDLDGRPVSGEKSTFVQGVWRDGTRVWTGYGVTKGWPGDQSMNRYLVAVEVSAADDARAGSLARQALGTTLDRIRAGPYAGLAAESVGDWFDAAGRGPTEEESAFLVAGILIALLATGSNVTQATANAVAAAVDAAVRDRQADVEADPSLLARLRDLEESGVPESLRGRVERLAARGRTGRVDLRELDALERERERLLAEERARIDRDHAAFAREGNRFAERTAEERAREAGARALEGEVARWRDAISGMRGVTAGDLDELDRILDEAGARRGVSHEDVTRMRDLARRIFGADRDRNERDRADWERMASRAGGLETGARLLSTVGRVAGNIAECALLPPTRGFLTGMVFGGAEGYDPDLSGRDLAKSIGWNAVLGGGFVVLGNRVQDVAPGSIAWGVATGPFLGAAEYIARTGSLDRDGLRGAALRGAAGGALSGALGKPAAQQALQNSLGAARTWFSGAPPRGLPRIRLNPGDALEVRPPPAPAVDPGLPREVVPAGRRGAAWSPAEPGHTPLAPPKAEVEPLVQETYDLGEVDPSRGAPRIQPGEYTRPGDVARPLAGGAAHGDIDSDGAVSVEAQNRWKRQVTESGKPLDRWRGAEQIPLGGDHALLEQDLRTGKVEIILKSNLSDAQKAAARARVQPVIEQMERDFERGLVPKPNRVE